MNILRAARAPARPMPKPSSAQALLGIRYERKIFKAFSTQQVEFEYQPWFSYTQRKSNAIGKCCVPDFLLRPPLCVTHLLPACARNTLLVIEVKLTYKPEAIEKLHDLYCPIVASALGVRTIPLLLVKNLTPLAPRAAYSIRQALEDNLEVMQWLGRSQFPIS